MLISTYISVDNWISSCVSSLHCHKVLSLMLFQPELGLNSTDPTVYIYINITLLLYSFISLCAAHILEILSVNVSLVSNNIERQFSYSNNDSGKPIGYPSFASIFPLRFTKTELHFSLYNIRSTVLELKNLEPNSFKRFLQLY